MPTPASKAAAVADAGRPDPGGAARRAQPNATDKRKRTRRTKRKAFMNIVRLENKTMLSHVRKTLQSTKLNLSIVLFVVHIRTWKLIKNRIAAPNLVMQAPSVQFLVDSTPNEKIKKAFPAVPWELHQEGAHIYAFRPISSLLARGDEPPEDLYDIAFRNVFFAWGSCPSKDLYDIAIRNMFFGHYYRDESLRRVTIEICSTLKVVNYNTKIAVFVADTQDFTLIRERLPILPNPITLVEELDSIPRLDDEFPSVPRAIVSIGEFEFAFGSARFLTAFTPFSTSYERIQAGLDVERMDHLGSDELVNSQYSA